MKQQETILRSLPLIAAMIGRAHGVTVIQDASVATACISQNRVCRIAPLRDVGTQEEADLVIGKIVHEAVHLRYRDYNAYGKTPFTEALRNIFDDVWGEREQAKDLPGAPRKITRALEIMIDRGLFKAPDEGTTAPQLITSMLISGLRSQELGQSVLQEQYSVSRDYLEKQIGIGATRKLWDAALQIRSCKSTGRAVEIAEEIEAMLKKESEQSPPQAPQSNQQKSEEGEGNGAGQGENDDEGDEDKEPQSSSGQGNDGNPSPNDEPAEGSPDHADAQSASGNQPGEQGGGSEKQDEVPPLTAEQTQALREMLDATEGSFGNTDFGEQLDQEMKDQGITSPYSNGAGNVFDPAPGRFDEMPERANDIRQRARPTAVKLGTRLEQLLETLTDTSIYPAKSGRRLMRSQLPQVAVGRYSVFRRREEEAKLDTAVCMVLDISTSMTSKLSDQKMAIDAAEEAAWALGDVLNKHDVPFSLLAFGSRTTPIKKFSDGWHKASRRVWANLESSTVTHQAIRAAVGQMISLEQSRKIMLLITDGLPSSIQNTVVDIREAQRLGIEVAILYVSGSDPEALNLELKQAGTQIRPQRVNSGQVLTQCIFKAVEGAFAKAA